MNLNDVEYYYIRNAQSDIIGLFDKAGTQVVSYVYDSWGKLESIKDGSGVDITNNTSSVGYKNPYRYKGYRYDTETRLYYLQSRYYNPEWGRFINADGIVGTPGELLSCNMFAYCGNNPINCYDPDGRDLLASFSWGASVMIDAVVYAVATAVIGYATHLLVAAVCNYIADTSSDAPSSDSGGSEEVSENTGSDSESYENAKSKGTPTDDHTVIKHKPGASNPNEGRPNLSSDLLKPDGSLKQRRYYGPDRRPDFDIDFDHPGETHVFPHSHMWDWSLPKARLPWEP